VIMKYMIQPENKKSLIENQTFTKDGKSITEVTVWRSGSFTCESDEPPVINEGDDLYSSDYHLDLYECMDGDVEYIFQGMTEAEQEEIQSYIDENSFFDLEFEGWVQKDGTMILDCPALIEEMTLEQ